MDNISFKSLGTIIVTFLIIVLLIICSLLVNLFWFQYDVNITNKYLAIGTLMLALVTLILAGASLWTIRQNYKLREKDRKERLLNEIIEWAMDVINCGFGGTLTAIPGEERERETLVRLGNQLLEYQSVDTRSKYITRVAKNFGKELHAAVLKVTSCLNTVRIDLPKHIINFQDETTAKSLSESEHRLLESAINLIELTTDMLS
jgi:hypothetical protein